jgi:hypothetical protein
LYYFVQRWGLKKTCISLLSPPQTCKECTTTCAVGKYLGPACSSDSYSDTACLDCIKCNPGFKSSCTGLTRTDEGCVACEACDIGFRITGGCPWGIHKCEACTELCDAGYYMAADCTGNTTLDDTHCMPCANCSVGQYISSGCLKGRTDYDTHTCAACPDCSDFSKSFTQGNPVFDAVHAAFMRVPKMSKANTLFLLGSAMDLRSRSLTFF